VPIKSMHRMSDLLLCTYASLTQALPMSPYPTTPKVLPRNSSMSYFSHVPCCCCRINRGTFLAK
jgi:hypothetical protein